MIISFWLILVPLNMIITNTTKWKQNGITVFHQSDFDEYNFNLNALYIDDDQTIYMAEVQKHRVIELKLNRTNISVVAGGNGSFELYRPTDIIIDKKSDSIIICDGDRRIVRWSRQNAINVDIIISDIGCNGLAMDDKGYLYVTDYQKNEVRRWDIGVKNKSIIVAGGNGEGNHLRQFHQPVFIFVDKDYSVYVVDTSNHRVMKWIKNATEGIVVAGGNGKGDKLTQLSKPLGVIVDHLGNVYVTDTDNDRVMRWINGAKEGSIVVGGNGQGNETNQLYRPSDLLFDKHGNLYVFDSANYRLQKFLIESN
jgi:DNA-binding beta-propeller fold protein YncE